MSEVPVNLGDFEPLAKACLPRMAYDYFAGGANDEHLLQSARDAWNAIELRFRVLRDVSTRSHDCRVLASDLAWPLMIAPMALQRMAHPEGECATARAAAASGCGMILSTLSTTAIEEVRTAMDDVRQRGAPLWFQLYIAKDRAATQALVQRAESAGATALVLTVDTPVLGRRERDIRNAFRIPDGLATPHLLPQSTTALRTHNDSASALATYVDRQWDDAISWRDVEWLRSLTSLPVLLKGVVRGDDAARALACGAAGVIVSNHGGRQLDASVTTARALREVAAAMEGHGVLLVDGGIRRGTDIVRALALGAHAVLLGRPVLWALAVGGEAGVVEMLGLLRAELDLAMALCGCSTLADVTPDLLAPRT